MSLRNNRRGAVDIITATVVGVPLFSILSYAIGKEKIYPFDRFARGVDAAGKLLQIYFKNETDGV